MIAQDTSKRPPRLNPNEPWRPLAPQCSSPTRTGEVTAAGLRPPGVPRPRSLSVPPLCGGGETPANVIDRALFALRTRVM